MGEKADELILDRLNKILRILAAIATKEMKQRDQIALLSQAGLQPKDIADLLGTSSNTVRVELVGLRRTRGRKKVRMKGPKTS